MRAFSAYSGVVTLSRESNQWRSSIRMARSPLVTTVAMPRLPDSSQSRGSWITSAATSASAASLLGSNVGFRMGKFLEVELQVRDYELDQYGVVNNAVYLSYCEQGNNELLKTSGVNPDAIARNGEALALTDLSLKFSAPLRSGDKFVVKVRISSVSPTRIFFEDFIYKIPDQEQILEAKSTGVWLGRNYRPVRIPPEIRARLLQLVDYSE